MFQLRLKKFSILLSLLLLLTILPACANVEGLLDIDWRGRGNFQLQITYPNWLDASLEPLLAQSLPILEQKGYEVELTTDSATSSMLTLKTPLPLAKPVQYPNWLPEEWLPTIEVSEKNHWWSKEYTYSVQFDWSTWQEYLSLPELTSHLGQMVKPQFVLRLPIRVDGSNAHTVDQGGKRLHWSLSLTEPNQLEVTIRLPRPLPILLTTGLLLLLLLFFRFLFRQRKKPLHLQ